MIKKISSLLLLTVALLLPALTGCKSAQKIPYLQGAEHFTEADYALSTALPYEARIKPKDLLTIVVTTTNPEASRDFNLVMPKVSEGDNLASGAQGQLQRYLVDTKGQIDFPVLGTLTLKGLTRAEAETLIKERLRPYIKEEPIVTLRFVNYKISVQGEVARPGVFTIPNEKVTLMEALAMAGDMTIYGRRDNIKLIREDAEGKQRVIVMNLNNPYTLFSPDFYLQQNDILYIEPNKARAQSSDIGSATGLWISGTSILISLTSLLVNILR